ncbi:MULTISPECIES: EscS/YscS/HrcS family type III secretion system export apparatus protein [Lonsdalea]|uniref:EscS/YscS/HrcS family type III secretion system export apparatus protein n=1 Tax=Lonsdalea iberica TaxID=1082703 RepID=A0ABX3XH74_9GAMM|nr:MULTISPECIES: EscS/YscS/HrcS family type III secretion system export apparatus protein [Lonsdalea]OSN10895.1 EscS/YscS/HrcS family type III secretion system export apparatus protein [Lonsdalea iberica]
MNDANLAHYVTQLMWLVLMTSLPVVFVASVVGIMVSLFQALTQIQDQTLQFMIKLLAVALMLMATYHWMGGLILAYTRHVLMQIGLRG